MQAADIHATETQAMQPLDNGNSMTNTIDPQSLKVDRVIEHDRQLMCCRFGADGSQLFAAGFDGLLHRWKLRDDDKHDAFPAPGGWIESMLLHPDGRQLFTADSWGQIRCWPVDEETLGPKWTIANANGSWLRKLALSPDGQQLATCGNDRVVRVFAATDGRLLHEYGGHEFCVQSVAFHDDGQSLVSGDQHGVVKHWNLADGKCRRHLDASKLFKIFHQYEQGGVRSLIFDPDFKTLYCGGFEGVNANQAQGIPTVIALDWASGEAALTMTPSQDFKGPVFDMVFHPAGYLVGAGSSEAGGALWFWKPGETQECHLIKNPTSFRVIMKNAGNLNQAEYKRSTIGLRVSTKERIDRCRAPGQCYDGFIQQMVEHWEKSRGSSR